VIKNPRERGGHSPRWAAEPEKIKKIIITSEINEPVMNMHLWTEERLVIIINELPS
jgi:hypothetical protein